MPEAIAKEERAAEPSKFDAIIDAWHREFFAGSATTELWNASFQAKEELKKRLR